MMEQKRVTGLMGAVCLALMFGLMWAGGATPGCFALLGLGAALIALVCLITEL